MKTLTVEELKTWIAEGVDFQLIDVREPDEFALANMDGELIPLAHVVTEIEKFRTDIPVVVHCRSGKRSEMAIRIVERETGASNLYNLQGGILAWQEVQD
jgi:rhodanese-related sulfurtransferase